MKHLLKPSARNYYKSAALKFSYAKRIFSSNISTIIAVPDRSDGVGIRARANSDDHSLQI